LVGIAWGENVFRVWDVASVCPETVLMLENMEIFNKKLLED
jgi:hypothetical protein